MVGRVRALKVERVAEGGSEDDGGLTEVDIGADYLDCAGVTLQEPLANTASADTAVRVERKAGALHFVDARANGTAGLDLSQLLTSAPAAAGAFRSLQDIRLWLDGPGDGFASGAVKQTVYVTNSPLVASETWFTDATLAIPLFGRTLSYAAGSPLPTRITSRLYSAAGALLCTAIDTPSYVAGAPLEASRTRTWSTP